MKSVWVVLETEFDGAVDRTKVRGVFSSEEGADAKAAKIKSTRQHPDVEIEEWVVDDLS